MSMSSGTRHIVVELASWAVLGVVAVAGITHLSELKNLAGTALGLQPKAHIENATGPAASEPPAAATPSGTTVELRRQDDGHYHAEIEVNGRRLATLVDTGASRVFLSYDDANNAGIYVKSSDYKAYAQTANGRSRIAFVRIDRLTLGEITVFDVDAAVAEPGVQIGQPLLGMSFLNRLSSVQVRQGTLVLQK